MCENYKYMLQIKPKYDIKFQKTGKHAQMIYLCEVKDVKNGSFKLNYDKERFNLLVKECGKCSTCRYKKASIKACQAQSEYKTVGKGSFITLTFGDEKIKEVLSTDKRYAKLSCYKKKQYRNYLQWTLEKKEFTNFIKRLRWYCYQEDLKNYSIKKGYSKNLYKNNGEIRSKILKCDCYDYSDFKPRKIRYMHAGEYGEMKLRPHHHAIIYGISFSHDKVVSRYSWKLRRNKLVYFNNVLSRLWNLGEATTDTVSYQTCNYVARYITKKVMNETKKDNDVDLSGHIYKGRLAEYCTSSNRNGLGYDYYMQNAKSINKDLQLTFKNNNGEIKFVPLPRYFKELMRRFYPKDFRRMQKLSMEKQLEFSNKSLQDLEQIETKHKRDSLYKDIDFIGDFEKDCIKDIDTSNSVSFRYKMNVFEDLSINDLYLKSYKDTDFIEKEYWRITCYKNFEKYRRQLKTSAMNEYVINRHNHPEWINQLSILDKKLKVIKTMDNPFTKQNLDIYAVEYCKKGKDLREEWLNYDTCRM